MTQNKCRWCTRFGYRENTESNYVLEREFDSVLNSEPYWFHKVQLWGIGSQVLKQCENQETNVSIAFKKFKELVEVYRFWNTVALHKVKREAKLNDAEYDYLVELCDEYTTKNKMRL